MSLTNYCFMKKAILTSLVLISLSTLQAQTKNENENITADFFKTYEKDPIGAYEKLFAGNKWMQKSTLEGVKIKLQEYIDQLGTYHGYESLSTTTAGKSYMLKSFLVKYERQPSRFTFILYKPEGKWQIQNFSYDNNLDDELEAAAKMDRQLHNLTE